MADSHSSHCWNNRWLGICFAVDIVYCLLNLIFLYFIYLAYYKGLSITHSEGEVGGGGPVDKYDHRPSRHLARVSGNPLVTDTSNLRLH